MNQKTIKKSYKLGVYYLGKISKRYNSAMKYILATVLKINSTSFENQLLIIIKIEFKRKLSKLRRIKNSIYFEKQFGIISQPRFISMMCQVIQIKEKASKYILIGF